MIEMIYKILTPEQWVEFAQKGHFAGSEHDKRDGFIHMCSGAQLAGTLAKHYVNVAEIVLVGFSAEGFSHDLKWEVSRGGEKFPHLYADLPFYALVNAHKLAQTPGKGFVLPSEF